jgi:alpha-L-rhamnosidase
MYDRPVPTSVFVRICTRCLVVTSLAASLIAATDDARPLNPNLVAARWPAFWIASTKTPATSPGVFYFRRELTLSTVPAHFWVHVSADNRFLLHVNGKYAAEGPAR